VAKWSNCDALPTARLNCGVASYKNWVYVAGGATNYAQTAVPLSILKSRIDAEGAGGNSNSPWLSCAPDMARGKIGANLLVHNDNLILVGGRGPTITGADILPSQDIFVGKFDANGDIPRWTQTVGALPGTMMNMGTVIKDDFLYILGGTNVKTILTFKSQTGNFTAGQTLTGLTSHATAVILSDVDGGATGTLTIGTVVGVFQSGETVVDPHGGSAVLTAVITKNLSYKTQTINFAPAMVVRGVTSGSLATVVSDADGGGAGTLTVNTVTGLFTDSEPLAVTHANVLASQLPAPADSFFLDYDTMTGAFTVGQVVTGAGGAFGTIFADVNGGATGTLTLTGVTGVFIDGEAITDPVTGVAKVAVGTVQYKTMTYNGLTIALAAGQVLRGLTSGATATVMVTPAGGAAGTVKIKLLTNSFSPAEALAVQYALADGALVQTIPYGSQTGNFTVGDTVTGHTSTAHGVIFAVNDSGATGSLILTGVVGTFLNNEPINGALGGGALADGTQGFYNLSLNSIYRTKLNPDGSFNKFETLSATLPVSGDLREACAVVDNHLFISNATGLWVAHIGPDGIGPFTAQAPGFSKISHNLMEVLDNRLLAVGGYTGAAVVETCYVAKVDSDGNTMPAVWKQTMPMSIGVDSGATAPRQKFGMTKIGKRIIVVGGADSNNLPLTSVIGCSLDPSGTIGGI